MAGGEEIKNKSKKLKTKTQPGFLARSIHTKCSKMNGHLN